MTGRSAAAAMVAVCLLTGCDDAQSPEPVAPGSRFARTFLPRGSEWISEGDVPREPQQQPRMVIWELASEPERSQPTVEERGTADRLVADSLAAAKRHGWFDFQQARADGYRLLHGDKRHYYNEDYVFDDRLLDPDRPEFLMFYGTPEGQKLAGMMFYARSPTERGPQIGGPLTRWHYHVWASPNCLIAGLLSVASADPNGHCERGEPASRSPEMLHVWLMEHPRGSFATSMWLRPPQLRLLMERDDLRARAAAGG